MSSCRVRDVVILKLHFQQNNIQTAVFRSPYTYALTAKEDGHSYSKEHHMFNQPAQASSF